jgi:hypothetical protein
MPEAASELYRPQVKGEYLEPYIPRRQCHLVGYIMHEGILNTCGREA